MVSAASTVMFFIKAYTSFSYEISIASIIFKPQKDEDDYSGALKMNILTFIRYSLYSIFEKIGISCSWPNYRYIS